MAVRRRRVRGRGARRKSYWTVFETIFESGSETNIFATARDPVETYNQLAGTPSSVPSIPEGDTLIKTIIWWYPTLFETVTLECGLIVMSFGDASIASTAAVASDEVMGVWPYAFAFDQTATGRTGGGQWAQQHMVKAKRRFESPKDLRVSIIRHQGSNDIRCGMRCLFLKG
jgi:hypothetical protein